MSKKSNQYAEGPSRIEHLCCNGCKWLRQEAISYNFRHNEYNSFCQHADVKGEWIGKDEGETRAPYWCPLTQ